MNISSPGRRAAAASQRIDECSLNIAVGHTKDKQGSGMASDGRITTGTNRGSRILALESVGEVAAAAVGTRKSVLASQKWEFHFGSGVPGSSRASRMRPFIHI